jgi:hypothetical protein
MDIMAHTIEPQPIPIESQNAGHELRDSPFGTIVVGFISMAVLLGTSIIVVIFLLGYFGSIQIKNQDMLKSQPVGPQEQVTLKIRLQVNPARDLLELQQKNQHILQTYGWVDQAKTRVHIPIEKAMEKALEQGFPSRQNAPSK